MGSVAKLRKAAGDGLSGSRRPLGMMVAQKLRNTILAIGPATLVLVLAGGCQQFFTASLASPLARDPAPITKISASEAQALAQAQPDQALAASALGALADLVAAAPSAQTVSDAATVAVISTGLDTALTQALVSSGGDLATLSTATFSSLLGGAIADITPDTIAIFSSLATMAATDPAALAASGVSAQTLVVAAIALALYDATVTNGLILSGVLDGTVPYTPSGTVATSLGNLAAAAPVLDANSQALVDLMQISLNITF